MKQHGKWVLIATLLGGCLAVPQASLSLDPNTEPLPKPPADRLFAYPDYSSRKVLYFRENTLEVLEQKPQVRGFIDARVDLLNNPPGEKRKPGMQWLQYKSVRRVIPGEPLDRSLLQAIDPQESAFVHARGKPQTRAYRLRYFHGDGYLMDPRSRHWQEALTDYVMELARRAGSHGVFLDEVVPYLYCGHWFTYPVVREEHRVRNASEVTLGEVVHPACPLSRIRIESSRGPRLVAQRFSGRELTLSQPVTGTIRVSYPALGLADESLSFDAGQSGEWKRGTEELVRRVTDAAHQRGRYVIYNGQMPYTNQPARVLPLYDRLPHCADGMMNEVFVHNSAAAPGSVPVDVWLRCVEDLRQWGATKRYWSVSSLDPKFLDTPAYRQVALFCYCSFLLGKGEWSYFTFGGGSELNWFWFYDIPLGRPSGEYVRLSETHPVFTREFEYARIVVNAGTEPASMSTEHTYTGMDGALISGTLTLPGTSGAILRKQRSP